MLQIPMESFASFIEEHLPRGWHVEREAAVHAVCVFATMCVAIVVALAVSVSPSAAGLYSISVGGLLLGVGSVCRICRSYVEVSESEVVSTPVAPSKKDDESGHCSVEFACFYPLGFVFVISLGLLAGLSTAAAVGCGLVVAGAILWLGIRADRLESLRQDENESPLAPTRNQGAGRMVGQRGSSVVEFAFIYPVIFVSMGGLFGLGQAFYTYNSIQSAIRSASRYGSLAAYDLPNGNQWKAAVRNMAVYGDPDPGPNTPTLVPGLTLANVQATAYVPETEPTMVTVAVTNFEFDFLFTKLEVSQPRVTFPFLGRALIP